MRRRSVVLLTLGVVLFLLFFGSIFVTLKFACQSTIQGNGNSCDYLDYGFASFVPPDWISWIAPPEADESGATY